MYLFTIPLTLCFINYSVLRINVILQEYVIYLHKIHNRRTWSHEIFSHNGSFRKCLHSQSEILIRLVRYAL